jgi:hypothetical protein
LVLERLDTLLRASPAIKGAMPLTSEALSTLGWSLEQASYMLRSLGFAPTGKTTSDAPSLWRRRGKASAKNSAAAADLIVSGASPFAALAALKPAPAPAPSPTGTPSRRRRPRRKVAASVRVASQ